MDSCHNQDYRLDLKKDPKIKQNQNFDKENAFHFYQDPNDVIKNSGPRSKSFSMIFNKAIEQRMTHTKIQFLNDKVKIFDVSHQLTDHRELPTFFEDVSVKGVTIYFFDGTPKTLIPSLNLVMSQDVTTK